MFIIESSREDRTVPESALQESKIIEKVVLHFAMEQEGAGTVQRFNLEGEALLHPALPARVRTRQIGAVQLIHCTNGIDPVHGVDRIGLESAATTAWALLSSCEPCLYINAGTCGGFAKRGGEIARSYLGGGQFLMHDHRVPLPGFQAQAEARIPAEHTPALERLLGIDSGPISSGSSLDATAQELQFFEQEGVLAKDMEAAAIASVARDWGIPFLAIKTVTDLVDHPEPSQEQFLRNLASSCGHLTDLLSELIGFLSEGVSLTRLRGVNTRESADS